MKHAIKAIAITFIILLAGCVTTQQPIEFNKSSISATSDKVGVVMTTLPQVDTSFPGAGCLLCLGAASMANSSLTNHAKTLPTEDVLNIKTETAKALNSAGINAIAIPDAITLENLPKFKSNGKNIAEQDFTGLKNKYGVTKLLVIDISLLGFERTYAAYIPTGDPKAALGGNSYLVNLDNNSYELYKPFKIIKSADGNWDEPKEFPGLTNAYFQAIELTQEEIIKPFTGSATSVSLSTPP